MTHQYDEFDELSPDDQRLLDALVGCGFRPEALEPLAPPDRERVDTLINLFDLLDDYPVGDADEALVYATLARIGQFENHASAPLAFDAAPAESEDVRRGRRFRLPDFISIAAVILIASGVVWPTTSYLRERRIDAGCANNLRLMGIAFTNYSEDYGGAMPVATAGMFNTWHKQAKNSINLGPLVKGHYCEQGHLDCPGNRHLDPSYSYQWQLPGARVMWGLGHVMVVLGDRNPIMDAARNGDFLPPLTVSLNHGGRGQNVLWSDGADIWLQRPVTGNGDNIWLPQGFSFLRVGASPRDPADVFLAH
ncbi:MAG: hypothetical protein ACYS0G_09120 [Planctomycetota bacterium]|jgi:hypothetical protein